LAMSVIVICAFGTTAPVLSVMVPKIDPYTACAKAEGVREVSKTRMVKYSDLLLKRIALGRAPALVWVAGCFGTALARSETTFALPFARETHLTSKDSAKRALLA
jgi:hypothetical protein